MDLPEGDSLRNGLDPYERLRRSACEEVPPLAFLKVNKEAIAGAGELRAAVYARFWATVNKPLACLKGKGKIDCLKLVV